MIANDTNNDVLMNDWNNSFANKLAVKGTSGIKARNMGTSFFVAPIFS